MSNSIAPSRFAYLPGRATALLSVLAVALAAAFVLAPRMLAASSAGNDLSDRDELSRAVREAFIVYWASGDREFSPELKTVVDYWFRYHVAKAVIAALLTIVLITLGVLLWKAFSRAGGPGASRSAALASSGVLVTVLGLFSLAVVMANVQGAVAPFASLLPMLGVTSAHGKLGASLDEIREYLAGQPGTGDWTPPAIEVMISDFDRYHLAMAVLAATVAVVLIGASVLLWKKFAGTEPSDRRTRRVWASFAILSAVLSLCVLVVAVANISTAADPAPALLAFFEGGW
ncbi:hypothetical protein ABZ348_03005 [Streptomyces sp. NPDC005963]|uniref:hypothetical protein n=1 Tax=Streptomyces sp. NPDC005963 TaxID=3156721 RepID=UPI0033CCCEF2